MKRLLIFSLTTLGLVILVIYINFFNKPIQHKNYLESPQEVERSLPIESKIKMDATFPPSPAALQKTKDSYDEIEALIKKLKSEDIQTAQEAADKLVGLGKRAVPKLLEKLQDAPIDLKGQIVFLLGRIGDKEATPTLTEILKDENSYVRRNAAEALGRIKDEVAISALSTALFDDDGGVRERSAWALGELKDSRTVESLLDRISDEKEEGVKSAVVNSLGRIKDQRATPALLTELKSESNQLYKNEVVISLGEIGDQRALADLTEYLDRIKQYKPTEPMLVFQWEHAIKIAEDAIQKIEKNN